MDRNQAQAHCILHWNLQSRGVVSIGLREVSRRAGHDLCSLLVAFGRLTPDQAVEIRKTVENAVRTKQIKIDDKPRSGTALLERLRRDSKIISTFQSPSEATLADAEKTGSKRSSTSRKILRTVRYEAKRELPNLEALTNPDQDTFMGLKIPNYKIVGEIASGGMGVVLRAFHEKLQKEVALKVLFKDEDNETVVKRFRQEARTLARLDHPNIVTVEEYGYVNEDPFLTMEFVIGKHLKDYVDQTMMTTGKVPDFNWTRRTIFDLAKAVQYLHDLQIIHRDIKPMNIIIEQNSQSPVLVDFGLIKRGDNSSCNLHLSSTGEVVGTPAYMAPEQLDAAGSHGEVGPKADVWGIGATLFFCLTGQPPYGETSAMNLYMALLTREPREAKKINKEAPDDLNEICKMCLVKDLDDRPAMQAVLDKLSEAMMT